VGHGEAWWGVARYVTDPIKCYETGMYVAVRTSDKAIFMIGPTVS
jgi:hypothetical protein